MMQSGVGKAYPAMKTGDSASKFLNADNLNALMSGVSRQNQFSSGGNRFNFAGSAPSAVQKAVNGDPDVILVKNAYAFNLPRFAPVGIDDVAFRMVTEQTNWGAVLTDDNIQDLESAYYNTLNAPVFYCTKTSYPRHNYRFGILQQSLNPCEIGVAIVSGVSACYFQNYGNYTDKAVIDDVQNGIPWNSNVKRQGENSIAAHDSGVFETDHFPSEGTDTIGREQFYSKPHAMKIKWRDTD